MFSVSHRGRSMNSFLHKLFGLKPKYSQSVSLQSDALYRKSNKKTFSDESSQTHISKNTRSTNTYFLLLGKFKEAVRAKNYQEALKWAKKSLPKIPNFIAEIKRSYGRFDISSIPALEVGGTLMAVLGDYNGIAEIRKTVEGLPELQRWLSIIENHEKDAAMVDSILEAVRLRPGVCQTMIKLLISAEDGRRSSALIGWLEKAGRIKRQRVKGTYKLMLVEASSENTIKRRTMTPLRSHRKDKQRPKIHELNLKSIPYVSLPRAPFYWEEKDNHKWQIDSGPTNSFVVLDKSEGLTIDKVENLPLHKRADPAFRKMYPVDFGVFMVDDLGSASGYETFKGAVLKHGRNGQLVAKRGLSHDIYRIGVNPLGRSMVAMSKDCLLHAYNEKIELILETQLIDAPEVQAALKRSGFETIDLKRLIRCVALSRLNSCYLFTIVDEAWCINFEGDGLWGIKLPIKEGWVKMPSSRGMFGDISQIQEALNLMQLEYPLSQDDVKRQYRQLAKKWHPDLNPKDPSGSVRMQKLIAAVELTGMDIQALSEKDNEVYMKEIHRGEIEPPGNGKCNFSVGIQLSPLDAYEWIYAANFAGLTNMVFIGTFSGRIIALDEEGRGLLMYDIGAAPRWIADNGNYLYFLTNTRLYVVAKTQLHAMIDVHRGIDLLVGKNGFGILEKNRFRCYREDGFYLGGIATKDPIRRVYFTPDGTIIETRQQRAVVKGGLDWWKDDN